MPIQSKFVGFHKISGERIIKVDNPVGLQCVYAVENGKGPYSGQIVPAYMVVATEKEVTGPEVVEADKQELTPEVEAAFDAMEEANDDLFND